LRQEKLAFEENSSFVSLE